MERCWFAKTKNSPKRFIAKPWKKLKLPNSSIDYVNNVYNKIKQKLKMIMPLLTSKRKNITPEQ